MTNRAVAVTAKSKHILIVVLEGDAAIASPIFVDEWDCPSDDRAEWYASIRKRLAEKLEQWQPKAVCIQDLEPFALVKGKPGMDWFRAAEVRGVVQEVAAARQIAAKLMLSKEVKEALGDKPDALKDNEQFWTSRVKDKVLRKYRDTALLALSELASS